MKLPGITALVTIAQETVHWLKEDSGFLAGKVVKALKGTRSTFKALGAKEKRLEERFQKLIQQRKIRNKLTNKAYVNPIPVQEQRVNNVAKQLLESLPQSTTKERITLLANLERELFSLAKMQGFEAGGDDYGELLRKAIMKAELTSEQQEALKEALMSDDVMQDYFAVMLTSYYTPNCEPLAGDLSGNVSGQLTHSGQRCIILSSIMMKELATKADPDHADEIMTGFMSQKDPEREKLAPVFQAMMVIPESKAGHK